jgi:FKBP-type peptidyl-prolyl cis-trans isomerase
MVMKSEDGTVLKNTYTEKGGKPMLFPIKIPQFPGDIYEAVGMMTAGDSAEFLINADSMYHKIFRSPRPLSVNQGSYLSFTIKVDWIKAQKDLEIKNHEIDVDRTLLAKQEDQILLRANEEGLENLTKTNSIYIYTLKEGFNEVPKKGQMISFNYTGKFFDGKIFESTIKENQVGHPISVTVGNQQVIRGWESAFPYLKVGGIYRVFVPSHMAFGPKGKGKTIPPNTPLIFDIDVVSIR